MSDVTFDMANNQMQVHQQHAEPWKVTLVDTGEQTMTGGRLKRVAMHLQGDDAFCLTYGDGVSDVNIKELIQFHRAHGLQATLTSVFPPGRFGALDISDDQKVNTFKEKPKGDGGQINGFAA
jgi:glucose-1-phosphate cytidylyltransferase